jgi:hypothetical protein
MLRRRQAPRCARSCFALDPRSEREQPTKGLKLNADGSVDVYFGLKPPTGFENNWVQTIPGKSWFVPLRLYGRLESGFDKTWRPREIEKQG